MKSQEWRTKGLEAIPGMSGNAGSDDDPVASTRNRQDISPFDVSTENPRGVTAARSAEVFSAIRSMFSRAKAST
jgi:hypothetical protein